MYERKVHHSGKTRKTKRFFRLLGPLQLLPSLHLPFTQASATRVDEFGFFSSSQVEVLTGDFGDSESMVDRELTDADICLLIVEVG